MLDLGALEVTQYRFVLAEELLELGCLVKVCVKRQGCHFTRGRETRFKVWKLTFM